jgi:hypothetical protein
VQFANACGALAATELGGMPEGLSRKAALELVASARVGVGQ